MKWWIQQRSTRWKNIIKSIMTSATISCVLIHQTKGIETDISLSLSLSKTKRKVNPSSDFHKQSQRKMHSNTAESSNSHILIHRILISINNKLFFFLTQILERPFFFSQFLFSFRVFVLRKFNPELLFRFLLLLARNFFSFFFSFLLLSSSWTSQKKARWN